MEQKDKNWCLPEDSAKIWQETLEWQPRDSQERQFERLYELILAANRQMNLTRITAAAEFWEKHLWDSLRGVGNYLAEREFSEARVIDIGTGAGFPGLAVAIALSETHVTLLDATRKKIEFLRQAIAELDLDRVATLVARAEDVGRQSEHREAYDLALLRAVAPPTVCAEYALPLLKIGGLAVLYRGLWTDADTEKLAPAVDILGGKITAIESFTTPISHSQRTCIHLEKVATTPAEFPRLVGIPSQKPL